MAAVQKRKRESQDIGSMRAAPAMNQTNNEFEQYQLQADDEGMDFSGLIQQGGDHIDTGDVQADAGHVPAQTADATNHASDTAAAAMAQFHTMTVPQSTEQAFMTQPTEGADRQGGEQGGASGQQRTTSFGDFDTTGNQSSPNGDGSPGATGAGSGSQKPSVGSDEWHKIRKDNHKEVERRRRETINEGINELAKIVPGCEKNKGSILQRAVQFITQLKDNESQNIEKWTLEKLLTEQAIAELSSSCDKLKSECQRAWAEVEQWKKAAQKAGVSIDEDGKGDTEDADAD
ncbi:basic helix-loop-helix protein [Saxophila tyrrhenica]|uniref:Basic helix-loop-helix protein n=1 Tax=Saxophila tyrrhenica TaxID=1690608 RepID=A0AAV9PGA8_9PEZI|nr:basic helix-loop-helix protein [Saxophila tyrrhenica]